jgi:hypothetical protein
MRLENQTKLEFEKTQVYVPEETPDENAKLSWLTPGILSCCVESELAGCVHRPIVDSKSTIAG